MSVEVDLKRLITQPLIEWKLMINYDGKKEAIAEIKDAVISTNYKKTYADLEYVISNAESADYSKESFELRLGIHDLKNGVWQWFNKGTYKVTEDSGKINPDTNTIVIKGIKNEPEDTNYIMLDSDYINQTVTAETDDNADSIVTKICPFADKCKLLVYKHSTYEILCSKTDIVKGTTEFTIEKMNDDYNNVKMLKEIAIRARTLTLESAVRA